ncbi:MAG TPA: class I SAM-dependent methyltransferase [Amycolatopsis sp.]|nr:class I SAM-dependent methyltransferase [Amycolatopsis sp.]
MTEHDSHGSVSHGNVGLDQGFWDDLYGAAEQLWSGGPNEVLVAEISAQAPGRALDVGCGEGGDARWLAARGWHVTAVDISLVALARAAAAGDDANITWRHLDLIAEAPEPAAYDLVSAHYFGFPRTHAHAHVLERVLAAVAPGGTLLVTSHAGMQDRHQGFCRPDEIAARLDGGWEVLVDETRPRIHPTYGHVDDVVLRARKRG